MSAITIDRKEFHDRVLACWMGKAIGGTLGAPYECQRGPHSLTYYDPVPTEAAPNDDLDLQLVWLSMLEDVGVDPPLPAFAEYWSRHAASYPWNEYGFFMRNYGRGLRPPVAGCFENYFVDEMGSPIRSEIWACLHAGDPQAAAEKAWRDSALDHAGGEGTCGEMFLAAVQAAAFIEADPETLIRIGLEMIPLSSHVGRSVREALWCRKNGLNWAEARERVATRFGHHQPCNAVPNHGFITIGWLYGEGFGDRLCKAVNCGYDTDCTGASLGALLGILGGTAAIPDKWLAPIGRQIVLHRFTRGLPAPATLDELADRTVALAAKAGVPLADATALPDDLRSRLFRNEAAIRARARDVHAAVELCDGREVWLHYGGEPVLRPGVAREVWVTLSDDDRPSVEITAPDGWTCTRLADNRFRLACDGDVADANTLTVRPAAGGSVDFTMLGPGQAKGYPAGHNVPECLTCRARVEACICPK
ncbi:MAG TPA: ADP-ribosylglycohydrolase family protein [Phycisphaerae bacterium]|nr:ADP-ribosylglycohydrolase family protein [Phycisphaerae bacterium]HUT59750.1 ADP-ribosylglycohydrolase family protein [Phycisphaerae bacterium]